MLSICDYVQVRSHELSRPLLWVLTAQKYNDRNFTWCHWQPPRCTALRDITSYRLPSKQRPVVCLRLGRWRHFLPSFRHFVVLALGTGEPISWLITVTVSSASNLRFAVAHWRPTQLNPLTPELNPSAQRCLTRLFTGDFASWTVHFVNICVKNQQIHQLFIQLINYVW
jgi:hypothetical protein